MRSRHLAPLLAAVLLAPAVPSLAAPAVPVIDPTVRSGPLALGTLTTAVHGERLVGVTWQAGRPAVGVRWHTPAGWSRWQLAESDNEADGGEAARQVPGTAPLWRPLGADLVQLRVTGRARGLRLVRVLDGTTRTVRSFSVRSLGLRPAAAETRSARPLLGEVASRADWGADESLRTGSPRYASAVRAVVVHHTANVNGYAASEVPAIIRADYAYHTQGRGWADLGYNLVVDRFGRIWEGRAGGIGRPTIGAHAEGFNTGTLGVSLIGDMTQEQASPAALKALARVIAFAAATWHFDPQGSVALRSGGSPRYAAGSTATLHRVFGHLETSQTSCPGSLQDRLGDLRSGAAVLLGPAPGITSVVVTGAPVHAPAPLVIRAGFSTRAPWRIALRDARGQVVSNSAGEGTGGQLVWNGLVPPAAGLPGVLPAPPGRYTWTVVADDGWHEPARRSGQIAVEGPVA